MQRLRLADRYLRRNAPQENNRSRGRASQSRDAAAILTLRFAAACSLVSAEIFQSDRPNPDVTRGLDPQIHPFRKKVDCRLGMTRPEPVPMKA
jgi:hypothetical protein